MSHEYHVFLFKTIHVSWNGATEVCHWRFYARAPANPTGANATHLPRRDRHSAQSGAQGLANVPGYLSNISIEELDSTGMILKSSKEEVHRKTLAGHSSRVTVIFSPNGKQVASASDD
ncbi:hypothetical protein BDW75DRAFT_221343 [Aspergillus navahoensis]